ncbi:MAG: FAD-dependent oxidoreductase, partial [Synergistetes bacterium]|nr:FAD-dependent oxidoreductase [Synergistota bacterium]
VVTPKGIKNLKATSIIYTTGARERHLYEIGITGNRATGIYTAGEAQTMMDIYGIMPGKEIVIVGSGDVGLIMARRFALEGAIVKAVIEIMPFPGGLTRNVVQCLQDFGIPLYLSHAVTRVEGTKRVERIIVSEVTEDLKIKEGTEKEIKCDTVVVAAGLVPYIKILEKIGVTKDEATKGPIVNEYLETSIPGVFTAGNALVINDLVDHVVEQGEKAADGALEFVEKGGIPTKKWRRILRGKNVRLLIPHYVSGEKDVVVYARVSKPQRNVKVRFPEIGKEVKLPVVKPAEMVSIKLKKEEIEKAKDKITMEVVSNE